MSLLLKALKQAETASAARPAAGSRPDLELEPYSAADPAPEREWVEPPALLFGSSGLSPAPRRAPAFRWPQLSLVPLAALLAALVALGYGGYLYFELRPPLAVAPPPADFAMPAAAPATPATAVDRSIAGESAPAAAPAAPVRQPAPATPAALPKAPVPPAAARPAAAATGTSPGRPAPAAALPQFQPDAQTDLLAQAYAAYQRGALTEATALYSQAAARGRSVDALLGLAAIAGGQGRDGDAQRLYREVLELDPRNATAQAALLDLLGNTDSQATESRLKSLIERAPDPQLYQTLGTLYAGQGRWNDAQSAYFEAYRGAPGNADYAFNLAVSLDQLRQYPAALSYYEKALASGGAHRYDRAQAAARVRELKALQ